MPSFPDREKQPLSPTFHVCRKCGRPLGAGEVYDCDGRHYCAECRPVRC